MPEHPLAEKFDAALVAMEDAFIAEQRLAYSATWEPRDELAMRLGFIAGSRDAVKLAVDAGLWSEPAAHDPASGPEPAPGASGGAGVDAGTREAG
jgi:hypothetical protein